MTTACYIVATLLIIATIYMTVRPYVSAPLPAYLALLLLKASGAVVVPQSMIIGWGAIAFVMIFTDYMQPQTIAKATNGTIHMSVGSLVGLIVGLSLMTTQPLTWMVVGTVVGGLCGALIYSRTPSASPLQFPSTKFWNYTLAKIFPIAVGYSIAGVAAYCYILTNYPQFLLNAY